MNSPVDHQPNNPSLDSRVGKLEVTCEHLVAEFREIREEMRAIRAEMREEFKVIRDDMREMREDQRDLRRSAMTDFCILFGALITVAVTLAGTMARGFGWI